LLVALAGCSREERAIRATLDFAGENRPELEAVLAHYADDPLKLAAAKRLIAGMRMAGHPVSPELDSIRTVLAETSEKGAIEPERRDRWRTYIGGETISMAYDAQTLSAEYLIENIDLAFEQWEARPWGRCYSFDVFCDYVLPYRLGDEAPDDWRRVYSRLFAHVLDSLWSGTDIIEAVQTLQKYLADNYHFVYDNDFHSPRLGGEFLLEHPIGACQEEADFMTYMLRSVGIAATSDSYIYAPDSFLGHRWSVFLDTTGKFIPMELYQTDIRRDWSNARTKGKVYRGDEDVTTQYYPANRVILPHLGRSYKGGAVCVFSMRGWIPIGLYGRDMLGRAVVCDIETRQIYMPMSIEDGSAVPCGHPFFIDSNDVATPLVPDFGHLQTVRLTRKHPITQYWVRASKEEDGVSFMGSMDGRLWRTLAISNTGTVVTRERKMLTGDSRPCRFIKVCPPPSTRLNIAELEVFADSSGTEAIGLSAMGRPRPLYGQEEFSIEKATDGRNLTRFEADSAGEAVIYELDRKTRIRRIDYAPRNDDNYVSPGDTYELFYQDGKAGWVSLGVQTASQEWLEFENVPGGALLWLHDITKGVEEQTFVWIGSRQVFRYEERLRE